MAAMTLADRIATARTSDSTFANQVAGSLVKHGKWVLRTAGQSPEAVALAKNVVNNPDGYVWRFGAAILTEPVHDALESVGDLTDQQVQDTVGELWPLFVA